MDIELKEETGFERLVTIKWEDIRRNNDADLFDQLTEITVGKRLNIPSLFSNINVGPLVEIEVSPTHQGYGKITKHMDIDEKWLSPLGFSSGPRVLFDTREDVQEFSKIYDDLKNGKFLTFFESILDGIRTGIIDGYDKYSNLKPLFDGQKGSAVEGDRYVEAMGWMDKLLSYMNRKMIRKSDGKSNVAGIKLLNTQLRKHFMASMSKSTGSSSKNSTKPTQNKPGSGQGKSGLSGKI
jgi:hypothetical protein